MKCRGSSGCLPAACWCRERVCTAAGALLGGSERAAAAGPAVAGHQAAGSPLHHAHAASRPGGGAGPQGGGAAQTLLDTASASWESLSLPGSVVTANVLAGGKPLATLCSLKRGAQRSIVLRACLPAALAAAPAEVGRTAWRARWRVEQLHRLHLRAWLTAGQWPPCLPCVTLRCVLLAACRHPGASCAGRAPCNPFMHSVRHSRGHAWLATCTPSLHRWLTCRPFRHLPASLSSSAGCHVPGRLGCPPWALLQRLAVQRRGQLPAKPCRCRRALQPRCGLRRWLRASSSPSAGCRPPGRLRQRYRPCCSAWTSRSPSWQLLRPGMLTPAPRWGASVRRGWCHSGAPSACPAHLPCPITRSPVSAPRLHAALCQRCSRLPCGPALRAGILQVLGQLRASLEGAQGVSALQGTSEAPTVVLPMLLAAASAEASEQRWAALACLAALPQVRSLVRAVARAPGQLQDTQLWVESCP